jgi:hypothetical protein
MSPPMMPPPMMPQAAGQQGGSGHSRGNGRRHGESGTSSGPAEIVLLPFDGMGGPAVLDPGTGAIYGLSALTGPVRGVYGKFGELPAAFYRHEGRLRLRTRDQVIDLDHSSIGIYWGLLDPRQVRFQVGIEGVCAFEVRYPLAAADFDFGLWSRGVLSDEQRRSGIFR